MLDAGDRADGKLVIGRSSERLLSRTKARLFGNNRDELSGGSGLSLRDRQESNRSVNVRVMGIVMRFFGSVLHVLKVSVICWP